MGHDSTLIEIEAPGPGSIMAAALPGEEVPLRDLPEPREEPKSELDCRTLFKLNELFELYDFGKERLPKHSLARWRDCLALAVQGHGVFVVRGADGGIATLGVFWRTKNPHVNLEIGVPRAHPNGNYVYIGWLWNTYGPEAVQALRDHIIRNVEGAEFICHHDQREKTRGRKPRGLSPLIVLDLTQRGEA